MYQWDNQAEALLQERFGKDSILALATVAEGKPWVRNVDAYYEDSAFYVITHALSNKMQQIAKNPAVALAGEWFTAQGIGENLGFVGKAANLPLMDKLCRAFAGWIDNGHTNLADENTCILRIRITSGVLLVHGKQYIL